MSYVKTLGNLQVSLNISEKAQSAQAAALGLKERGAPSVVGQQDGVKEVPQAGRWLWRTSGQEEEEW